MGRTVDYYLAPQSPWAYLGHQRLADIVQRTGATLRVMPIDLGGKVFPISGGLPLGQRAPQRQAYRLVELQRFSQHLNVPLNLKPKYFPVGGDDSARLIIATDLAQGAHAAMHIAGAILAACWAQERNMADDKVLAQLLQEQNLPASLMDQSRSQAVQERYEGAMSAVGNGGRGAASVSFLYLNGACVGDPGALYSEVYRQVRKRRVRCLQRGKISSGVLIRKGA
jgi:carboxymethylenebutenolidase